MRRMKVKSSGDVRMRILKELKAAVEAAFKKSKKRRSCGDGRSHKT